MLIKPTHISEALRIFRRSLKVRVSGFKKYDGDAKEICERIINDCFNGKYFQTSTGHFCQFWTRDFGMCAESLVKLGYKKEVGMTLEYALDPLTSMVRQNVHFSSIKDHYVRNSATYDNCMLVMLKNDLNELKLYNLFN